MLHVEKKNNTLDFFQPMDSSNWYDKLTPSQRADIDKQFATQGVIKVRFQPPILAKITTDNTLPHTTARIVKKTTKRVRKAKGEVVVEW